MPGTELDEFAMTTIRDSAPAAVHSLLSGQEPNPFDWKLVKTMFNFLLTGSTHSGVALPAMTMAFGQLAVVIAQDDLNLAREAASHIPEAPECATARRLARTIIAKRQAQLKPNDPDSHAKFAECMYSLLVDRRSVAEYISAHRQIVASLLRFFEIVGNQPRLQHARSEACQLTGAASQLAWKFGIASYLDLASKWGEDVVIAGASTTGEEARDIWMVAINLFNIYQWLARDNPMTAKVHRKQALRIAQRAAGALAASGIHARPEMWERTLRSLISLHASLVMESPEERDLHITAARQRLAQYAGLRLDSEFQEKVERLTAQLESHLSRATAGRAVPTEHVRTVDEYLPEMDSFQEEAAKAAERINALDVPSEREDALSKTLGEWYSALQSDFLEVLSESGFDYSLCKFILGLGATAHERLGPNTAMAVRHWILRIEDGEYPPNLSPIHDRQFLSIRGEHRAKRLRLAGRVVGLAKLGELLKTDSESAHLLNGKLRAHNAALLRDALYLLPCVQQYPEKNQRVADDLNFLVRGFSVEATEQFFNSYASRRV